MGGGENRDYDADGIPTDGMAAILTRRSSQARRSSDAHRRSHSGSLSYVGRRSGDNSREGLMHNYDLESAHPDHFGLGDLAEDDEENVDDTHVNGKVR